MSVYYNEIEPYPAEWIRNLIKAELLPDGEVDERSIEDVAPDDLRGFGQCHFFAGIGLWAYAVRRAGYEHVDGLWTGSCPCQPFSAAGKGAGFDDERHLWPAWFWLICQQTPSVVFGEQVASKDGLVWLDLVSTDLEGAGYAVGTSDLCAAGIGAPHIRQRLWFVGHAVEPRLERHAGDVDGGREPGRIKTRPNGSLAEAGVPVGGLPDASSQRREGQQARLQRRQSRQASTETAGGGGLGGLEVAGGDGRRRRCDGVQGGGECTHETEGPRGMGGLSVAESLQHDGRRGSRGGWAEPANGSERISHADRERRQRESQNKGVGAERGRQAEQSEKFGAHGHGAWSDFVWLPFDDAKVRPIEPGLEPMAYGDSSTVGRIRAYGNAICPQVAQAFIEVAMKHRP